MRRSPEADAFTDLILEVFRINGQLLAAGDHLTKPLGLTSARWQVLGAIDLAGHPMTVAQISRRMGVSRQSVQRIANDLKAAGFISFEPNLDHARAKLIVATAKGKSALEHIATIQAEWANTVAKGMAVEQLVETADVLRELQARCEKLETAPEKTKAQSNA